MLCSEIMAPSIPKVYRMSRLQKNAPDDNQLRPQHTTRSHPLYTSRYSANQIFSRICCDIDMAPQAYFWYVPNNTCTSDMYS